VRKLVLATGNSDKVKEFTVLLSGLPVDILTMDQFPSVPPVVEDAASLEGNARKKAIEVFSAVHLPTIADDSALEVHYLHGEPGVYSSRYAGVDATYAENRRKLLQNLMLVPPRRRTARFRCVLCFVGPGIDPELVEGKVIGWITERERGSGGFGYDPIFLPEGSEKTLAEMSLDEKNMISHRARAVECMRPILMRHLV
jgi:XTP/dITP diphosphohydrolase